MLQKDNRYKVLKVFLDDPMPVHLGFGLREISRKVHIAPTSVKKYLGELKKEGLILKEHNKVPHHYSDVYYANRDNEYFRFLKKIDTIKEIYESGILDYLSDGLMPDAIILFGSASRGEDLKKSDLDLFLLCKEKKIDLKVFEKKIGKTINLIFSEKLNNLSKELRNNILNGIILKGYIEVF